MWSWTENSVCALFTHVRFVKSCYNQIFKLKNLTQPTEWSTLLLLTILIHSHRVHNTFSETLLIAAHKNFPHSIFFAAQRCVLRTNYHADWKNYTLWWEMHALRKKRRVKCSGKHKCVFGPLPTNLANKFVLVVNLWSYACTPLTRRNLPALLKTHWPAILFW